MADNISLDQELRRILEGAGQRAPVAIELPLLQPHQAATWPWQVPQVPTVTSDRTPSNNNN